MILIYCHHITPRVTYAINLVFKSVLNTNYELTSDLDYFKNYTEVKIAYTTNTDNARVSILSQELLFENDIKPIFPTADKSEGSFPQFFKSRTTDFLGYDVFAMVFYFATRYEEYVLTDLDKHQRFKAEQSIAYKNDCLHIPFLNNAIDEFADKLQQQFPDFKTVKRKFNFLSTIDIDNAFAYAHKGFKRNVGGLVKELMAFKFSQISKRFKSIVDDKNDPYNTFELINNLSKESKTALHYFVLIGDYATFDKNPHYKNKGFLNRLKTLSSNYTMGLHPSYESFHQPEKIGIEKKRLEDITGKKVNSARCHFLRVNLPQTYRTFLANGITDDYTMIYASQSGFRTGLCVPFKWFDLQKNETTNLTIHTSVIMEGTLRDYNQLSANDAQKITVNLMQEVKKHGGEFISIFHNDTFVPEQKEWIDMYNHLLQNSKTINS